MLQSVCVCVGFAYAQLTALVVLPSVSATGYALSYKYVADNGLHSRMVELEGPFGLIQLDPKNCQYCWGLVSFFCPMSDG